MVLNEIAKVEQKFDFKFPPIYKDFLINLDEEVYEIHDTGICLYHADCLIERNTTYSIQADEPDALMIGQDGDLGFYLRKDGDEQIFELGLGALGSLPMRVVGNDVNDFMENIKLEYLDDE